MIVSDVGALPELVKDPRCIVPPNDPEALAERILLGLRDQDFRRQASIDAKARAGIPGQPTNVMQMSGQHHGFKWSEA